MTKPTASLLALAFLALAAGVVLWLLGTGSGEPGAVARTVVGPGVRPGPGASAAEEGAVAAPGILPDPGLAAAPGRQQLETEAPVRALDPGARSLRGRVVDAQGQPVAGARVFVAPNRGFQPAPLDLLPEGSPMARDRGQTRSASDGTFRVDPPAGGGLRLAVRAPLFAPLRTELGRVEQDGDLGELVLEAGVVLEGRVVDRGGRPVPNVEVHSRAGGGAGALFLPAGWASSPLAGTDAEGRFRLDELAAGPYGLDFQHPLHPDHLVEGLTARPGEVVSDLVVELADGHEVKGWARGLEGHDPANLRVRARGRLAEGSFDFGRMPRQRTVELASDGSFSVGGLTQDQAVELVLVSPEAGPFGGERSAPVQAHAGERGIELRLRAESALLLRVVDARSAAPIETFQIEAGGRWRTPLRTADRRPLEHHPGGVVRFAPLEIGAAERASVRISAAGYEVFERSDLVLQPGQELDLGIVALQPAPLLEVHVASAADGRPIEDAQVALVEWEGESSRRSAVGAFRFGDALEGSLPRQGEQRLARTDARGVAQLTALPGRTCFLTVRHPEYVEFEGEPFPLPGTPSEPLSVTLGRGGEVVVRVLDPTGQPLEGIGVQHRPPATAGSAVMMRGGSRQTGRDGQVSFERLIAGRHGFRLVAAASGGIVGAGGGAFQFNFGSPGDTSGPAYSEVDVVEGGRAELELSGPRRAVLGGRVREAGAALAGATLGLRQRTEGEDLPAEIARRLGGVGQVRTAGDGSFVFEPQALGRYWIEVTHPSRAMPHEVEATLEEGGAELLIDLPLTAIRGRALDERGSPIAGLKVAAVEADPTGSRPTPRPALAFAAVGGGGAISLGGGRDASVLTEGDGRYELRGLKADRDIVVRVEAQGDWQPAQSAALRLEPGEVRTGVDLHLARGGSLSVSVLQADGSPAPVSFLSAAFTGKTENLPEPRRQVVNEGSPIVLSGLAPGLWRLGARRLQRGGGGEGEPVEIEVRAGEQRQVVVRLP